MVRDERLTTYIRSLEGPEDPVIEQIEQEAAETYVPIIRKETQSFKNALDDKAAVPRTGDRDGYWFFCDPDERIYAGGRADHHGGEV